MISEDPPPNFELFPTETWDFFDFLTTPPLNAKFPSFVAFSNGKLPLGDSSNVVSSYVQSKLENELKVGREKCEKAEASIKGLEKQIESAVKMEATGITLQKKLETAESQVLNTFEESKENNALFGRVRKKI